MTLSVFNNLQSIPHLHQRTVNNLIRLVGGNRIIDLLLHAPHNIIERINNNKLKFAKTGDIITSNVKVLSHIQPNYKSSPYRIICSTQHGDLTIAFFNSNKHYIKTLLPIGAEKIISGKISKPFYITNPDYVVNSLSDIKPIEPVYPLTYGISNRFLINTIKNILTLLPHIDEWISDDLLSKNHWSSFQKSIFNLHNPKDLNALTASKQRLGCDECLVYQLKLQEMRSKKHTGRSIRGNGHLRERLHEKLPFSLTKGQKRVIDEITNDQASHSRMSRLLQGDVGSGKTVVLLFAILNAVECGKQAALMAPTEIVATQHFHWVQSMVGDIVNVTLLTGSTRKKRSIQDEIYTGVTDIVIGTHALFQEKIQFQDLALAVIDEQHRFGVKQRKQLLDKGNTPDMLLVSATPIPRTLNLTLYGDLDVSILNEKPSGRLPITTSIIHKTKISTIVDKIQHNIISGTRIYWVCPLIEESEKLDMAAVIDRYQHLFEIFPNNVGLIHGKMSILEREKIMLQFQSGQIQILIATTVIEVGVDVPEATIMVIENAERFGLSQLHQLRGRIGRGTEQSFCILLYEKASKITYQRLLVVRNSNDGFYIAEQDLKLRGAGEIAGYKQSGLPNLKFIDLENNEIPFSHINQMAKKIISTDSKLDQHQNLKLLKQIFNRDKEVSCS